MLCDLQSACIPAESQRQGLQPVAATGKGGDPSRQSLESLRSENEALRNSISEAEAAVGQLSGSSGSGGGSAAGGPDSPEAVLNSAENGATANGNKTSATAAPPPSAPSAERPAGMPSTSNEHAGGDLGLWDWLHRPRMSMHDTMCRHIRIISKVSAAYPGITRSGTIQHLPGWTRFPASL